MHQLHISLGKFKYLLVVGYDIGFTMFTLPLIPLKPLGLRRFKSVNPSVKLQHLCSPSYTTYLYLSSRISTFHLNVSLNGLLGLTCLGHKICILLETLLSCYESMFVLSLALNLYVLYLPHEYTPRKLVKPM